MSRIYLDYAASAPLMPEARQIIQDYVDAEPAGNPSSLHTEGRQQQARLDQAHTTVAAVFGVQPTEVIFTSGATEANNLVIQGILRAWKAEKGTKSHVVFSAIEHPSWYQAVRAEEADITIVPVSKQGVVSAEAMLAAIRSTTALVGCMYVNNEIGTVQPVADIGKGIESRRTDNQWPVFHSDAVQAFPYLNTHSGHIHVDTVTLSGHKYGALGGIGALLKKEKTPLRSVLKGGGQEWGYRAGTENVLGAMTLATMMSWHDAHREESSQHVRDLQAYLETRLAHELPEIVILGQHATRTPHITYLWLPDVMDEHVVHKLDLNGIAVSSGSACSSGAMLPSATLLAMGYSDKEAFGGIRVSYGRFTTKNDLDSFVDALKKTL